MRPGAPVQSQQRELIGLNRQGTQQQRPESPTLTPPGMQVNAGYQRVYPVFTRMPGGITADD